MSVKRVATIVAIVLCTAGAALAQTEWVDYPDNPVLGPGEPGAWDEAARYAGSVILVGSTYHMWFVGGDTTTGAGDSIGHATSTDGVEWAVDPANPVLTPGAAGEWDEIGLWLPSVVHDGTQFHMWYSGFQGQFVRGGYATSPDGSVWTKHPDNPVMDLGPAGSWEDRHVRPGGVVHDGGTFKMWYSGWGTNTNVQIGYAESTDGVHWTRNPDPVIGEISYPGVWDSRACNPSVLFNGALYHMWYAGYDPSIGDWSVGYAFSTDGITWTRHRHNPVLHVEDLDIVSMPVYFDGSTWHGWYVLGDGRELNYATSDRGPGEAALDHMSIISAAAVASGAEGAFFQTDLDLSNRDSQPVEYQLVWLPRGANNSEPMTSETFSLGAGMSVRYANVLSEVFDLEPDSLGALMLMSSSPDLLAMSRTYNTPTGDPAGTYGQSMPAIALEDMIHVGERRRILFGTENADMRTNLGCQSGVAGNSMVNYELFDMQGNSLGTGRLILHGWGNDQVNRIFQDFAPIGGYVEVWTLLPTASFYCYGSVLDNLTSDPTTIPPQ